MEKFKQIKSEEAISALYNSFFLLDSFFNENHLNYVAYAGTLLGAIRSNSIIPWDVDIDLAMPRKDYDKFLNICAQINDKRISFLHYSICKKSSPNSHLVVKVEKFYFKTPNGTIRPLTIDIFPIDYCCAELEDRIKVFKKMKPWYNLRILKSKSMYNKSFISFFASLIFLVLPLRLIDRKIETIYLKETSKHKLSDGCTFCYCGIKRSLVEKGDYLMPFSVDFFEKTTSVPFGKYKIKVPSDSYVFLKFLYGEDFMVEKKDNRFLDTIFLKGDSE